MTNQLISTTCQPVERKFYSTLHRDDSQRRVLSSDKPPDTRPTCAPRMSYSSDKIAIRISSQSCIVIHTSEQAVV